MYFDMYWNLSRGKIIYIVQNLYKKVTTKLAAMALTKNVHSGMPCGGKMAVDL